MGLDISFALKPVIDACDVETKIDVVDYRDLGDKQQRMHVLFRTPNMPTEEGMKIWAQADVYPAASDGELRAMVRANKWGRLYDPLTTWLKEHNIAWVET